MARPHIACRAVTGRRPKGPVLPQVGPMSALCWPHSARVLFVTLGILEEKENKQDQQSDGAATARSKTHASKHIASEAGTARVLFVALGILKKKKKASSTSDGTAMAKSKTHSQSGKARVRSGRCQGAFRYIWNPSRKSNTTPKKHTSQNGAAQPNSKKNGGRSGHGQESV